MAAAFERLGALDRFFLHGESDATPMHVGAVCFFEGKAKGPRVTVERLRSFVASKLDDIPHYRQRIAYVPLEGHPVWIDADPFHIENHVHAVAVPWPKSAESLEETISWIFSRPLARNVPLWEMWLIEGLQGGGFALVCKMHHCMTDGLGGASLMSAVLGTEPFSGTETAQPWQGRPSPGAVELLQHAIRTRANATWSLLRRFATQMVSQPENVVTGAMGVASAVLTFAEAALRPRRVNAFGTPCGTARHFLWWTASLDDVKQMGRRLGGTVNDVVLGIACEAFARVCPPCDGKNLRVFCPVGSHSGMTMTLGNKVSGMLLDLPTAERDIRRRWKGVLAAVRQTKKSGQARGPFLLAEIADALAPSLLSGLESLFDGRQAFNVIVTNVPGPPMPLYLFENRMTRVCPLVPLFNGQSLGIAIFSYNGTLTWGFHVDAASLAAARLVRDALAPALADLARLAEVRLASTPHGRRERVSRRDRGTRATPKGQQPQPVAPAWPVAQQPQAAPAWPAARQPQVAPAPSPPGRLPAVL